MSKLLVVLILLLSPVLAMGAGGTAIPLQKSKIDLYDQESLQRGAQYYVDYCMGCHSLEFMRYSRLAEDLGIDEADLRANLLRGGAEPGDMMTIAMRPDDAEAWFGMAVPDLTLVTRWRSPDWVYTFLKSFYLDPSRPYGVNNALFQDVGMPHMLGGLQGTQRGVYKETMVDGEEHKTIKGVELVEAGDLSPEAYDQMVRDLTAFLTYAGEPIILKRREMGIYVLLFLGVFFVLAYALKKEYWKDVH